MFVDPNNRDIGVSMAEEKDFLAEPRNVVHSFFYCSKLLYR